MTKIRRFVTLLAVAAGLLALPVTAAAGQGKGKGRGHGPGHGGPEAKGTHEVDLELVGVKPNKVAIQAASGWPLTTELIANEKKLVGIGVPVTPPRFPQRETPGFLVFDDPDGCPSWVAPGFQDPATVDGCSVTPPWPFDETWVELLPGISSGGSECDDDPATTEIPACEEQPEVLRFDPGPPATTALTSIGPPALGSVDDGYGYGPSGRLPGLVVVADAGPSIVTDENFDRPTPMQCRNLAGFANSVAYELANSKKRTTAWMHMNVPSALFTPVVLIDRCVRESEESCADDPDLLSGRTDLNIVRIDGSPEVELTTDGGFNTIDFIINNLVVTARAFVVNPKAPSMETPSLIEDLDGNGVCDVRDAELMGYQILSDQEIVRFRQIHELAFGLPFDFDDNTRAIGSLVAPGGAGTLTQPPR